MSVRIESCPCCGKKARAYAVTRRNLQGDREVLEHVSCIVCGLRTPQLPAGQAVALWNSRVSLLPEQQQPEQ